MIYFLTSREYDRVKIGFSSNPQSRFASIQTSAFSKLKLERVCEGGVADEAALHARFKEYHCHGEWFLLSREIEAFMDALEKPAQKKAKPKSVNKLIMEATGVSKGFASQVVNGINGCSIGIPMAVSVYRHSGERIAMLVGATNQEIDTLEKYCGLYCSKDAAA